jgi:hypothetical protein
MVWTVHLEKELFMSRKFASSVVLATLLNIFSTTPPNTPIAASYLMERTGESIRVVRDGIQRLIQEYKMPIISDRNGSYVLSTRPAVIEPEIMRLKSQAREIRARYEALEAYVQRVGGSAAHSEIDEVIGPEDGRNI